MRAPPRCEPRARRAPRPAVRRAPAPTARRRSSGDDATRSARDRWLSRPRRARGGASRSRSAAARRSGRIDRGAGRTKKKSRTVRLRPDRRRPDRQTKGSVMFRTALSLALSSLALGACILPNHNTPKSGAVPTGEPLAIVDDVKVWTETHKEKVGETEYKDADGNVVGTGTTYADKTETHAMKIWYPVQGAEQLSDEDFFRISGEQ